MASWYPCSSGSPLVGVQVALTDPHGLLTPRPQGSFLSLCYPKAHTGTQPREGEGHLLVAGESGVGAKANLWLPLCLVLSGGIRYTHMMPHGWAPCIKNILGKGKPNRFHLGWGEYWACCPLLPPFGIQLDIGSVDLCIFFCPLHNKYHTTTRCHGMAKAPKMAE